MFLCVYSDDIVCIFARIFTIIVCLILREDDRDNVDVVF